MTPIHNMNTTADVDPVYEPLDELTQDEMERIIKIARKVKSGEIDTLVVQCAYKNSNGGLYIKGLKKVAA